jgi:hypothetical protein
MRKLVGLLCVILVFSQGRAQQITIRTSYKNVVYFGMPNRTEIKVEGYDWKILRVTSDNGSVTSDEYGFQITPDHLGTLKLTIKANTKSGIKDIGSQDLIVKCLEARVALMGKTSGTLPADKARQILTLQAPIINSPFDASAQIIQVRVKIVSNYSEVVNKLLTDSSYVRFSDDDDVGRAIRSLHGGDKLIVSDIRYAVPGNAACIQTVPDMEFTIID